MQIHYAQLQMRSAYLDGGPGVAISGNVWLVAALVAHQVSPSAAMLTLFLGGMAIFPLSVATAKLLGRTGCHSKDNPLGHLALETTALLFGGLFIAYSASLLNPNWFFPVMLIIIGCRYLMFHTLYGLRRYWLLGAILALSGVACISLGASAFQAALYGGVVELTAGGLMIKAGRAPKPATNS